MKRVEFSKELYDQIKKLPKVQRSEIGDTIRRIQEAFGDPHFQRGLGLRKLLHPFYEARIGLETRLVFKENKESLYFIFIGNHDQVRRFLKSL